eukprot:7357938-Pyramimonas_sp.AAC.1
MSREALLCQRARSSHQSGLGPSALLAALTRSSALAICTTNARSRQSRSQASLSREVDSGTTQ